jgi:hypothetical protein
MPLGKDKGAGQPSGHIGITAPRSLFGDGSREILGNTCKERLILAEQNVDMIIIALLRGIYINHIVESPKQKAPSLNNCKGDYPQSTPLIGTPRGLFWEKYAGPMRHFFVD